MLASLQAIPGLEVSLPHRRFLQEQPDDALYSHQSIYYGLIHAPQAWDATHGSSTVSVAVIDSGVDIGHPDLASKISATYNAVDGSADVSDSMGHGTFIAGVVGAATGNGSGVAGMGWNTTVTAVKVANAA
ncbi:MAG: S8 family serine peptidase, partial [Pseudorhodobacter sp.]|nr:S8 family serine peptidase [Frankiaceae bacterium]